jgi:NADPH:quinone reductase-like Zn-dependent oxidoreductase
MQAAGIAALGGEVRLLELAAPVSPAPDEVVISVHAAGVGNWDEIVRVGGWDVGRRPPLALSVEAAAPRARPSSRSSEARRPYRCRRY